MSMSQVNTMNKQELGFTLIEMLIVLAIAGVLLSIAGLTLSNYNQNLQLSQATQTLDSTLRLISNEALKESRELTLDESSLSDGKLVWKADTSLVGEVAMPSGVTVSVSNKDLTSTDISFSGRGLPNQQATFTVNKGSKTDTIILLGTGLVIHP